MEDLRATSSQNLKFRDESQLHALFQNLNQEIVGGVPFDLILEDLFDHLVPLVPFDRIGIAILSEDRARVRLIWTKAKMNCKNLVANYEAPLEGSSLAQLLENQQPRIIDDLEAYYVDHPNSESTRLALLDQVRSNLTLPLFSTGRPVGFVFFSSQQPFQYQPIDNELLAQVSNEISMIIDYGLRDQRLQSQRDFEKRYCTVLHDLKSPLNVFKGYVEILKDQYQKQISDPQKDKIFEILSRSSENMMSLVGELCELQQAKVVASRAPGTFVDLTSFLRGVCEQAEAMAHLKKMNFLLIRSESLPSNFRMNSHLIRRVLENYLSNAFKFSPSGSRVELEVSNVQDGVKFSVKDQGPGIPKEECAKLFTEYGCTSVLPKLGEQSSGLGLAISKDLVERHGGQVGFESVVGGGSTFWFILERRAVQ